MCCFQLISIHVWYNDVLAPSNKHLFLHYNGMNTQEFAKNFKIFDLSVDLKTIFKICC